MLLFGERPFKQQSLLAVPLHAQNCEHPRYSLMKWSKRLVAVHCSFLTQSACKYAMQKNVIGQCILGIISSPYTMAKPFISSDPFITLFYKTISFYADTAFQNPGHIVQNNKHCSYHWKASFLALPEKLFFWGNMCRQDAPPFPSQWPPIQQLSEDEWPPWILWLQLSWAL